MTSVARPALGLSFDIRRLLYNGILKIFAQPALKYLKPALIMSSFCRWFPYWSTAA